MSRKRHFGFNFVLCLVATTAVATAALLWLGITPVAAVLTAVALGCPLAALYSWWLARRAVKSVERVAPGMTTEEKLRRQRS
jgi:membrane protein implicated in regulation of membrane protease activity